VADAAGSLEVDWFAPAVVEVGIGDSGSRIVSDAGFAFIIGVIVAEGMRLTLEEGSFCSADIDTKTSCIGGKSVGFGSLSPNAQNIFV